MISTGPAAGRFLAVAATTLQSMATTTRPATADRHRNEVLLGGELLAGGEIRTRPDGVEVTAFRLAVRSAKAGGRASPAERIDCVAVRAAARDRVSTLVAGDLIEVDGTLRHRYWRSVGGLSSRYEVEADRIRVVRRVDRI